MTTLSDDLPSLYDITGKITDHNTLLINRNVLRQLEADAERFQKIAAYLVSDEADLDDDIVAQTTVDGIATIVDQMKGQQ